MNDWENLIYRYLADLTAKGMTLSLDPGGWMVEAVGNPFDLLMNEVHTAPSNIIDYMKEN